MERIQGANPRTHLTVVIGGLAIALVSLMAIMSVPSIKNTGSSGDSATPVDFGRTSITTTPSAKLSGTITMGGSAKEDTLHWRILMNDKLGPWNAGETYTVYAPASGSFTIIAAVQVGKSEVSKKLRVDVLPASAFVGTGVTVTKGTVLVDGGLAVNGESLKEGSRVDATDGTITYTVKATTNSKLTGDVSYSGAQFTVSSKTVANRKLNIATVDRDPHGATVQINAEVEHLDGVRYQAVATPDALAMVKGTEFTVTVSEDETTVEVEHGVVRVLDRMRLFADADDIEAGEWDSVETIEGQEAFEDFEAVFEDSPWIGNADIEDGDDEGDDGSGEGDDNYIDPDDTLLDTVDDTLNNRDTSDLEQRYETWLDEHPDAPKLDPEQMVDRDGDGIPDAIDSNPDVKNGDPTKLPPPDCTSCPPPTGTCTPTTCPPPPCITCEPKPCTTATCPPPPCSTCTEPCVNCEPKPCATCEPCPSTGCTTQPPPPCSTCTEPCATCTSPPPPPPTCNTCTEPCATCTSPPPPPPSTCLTCSGGTSPPPPPPSGTYTAPLGSGTGGTTTTTET